MDIKELDKKQLILLTLLITFVVSIATGIVTVSLMNQMPKSVPQTINNVIQRTIEKVKTVEVPSSLDSVINNDSKSESVFDGSNVLVPIYNKDVNLSSVISNSSSKESDTGVKSLGEGVIISDVGLILAESNILEENVDSYKVLLNNTEFNASILKRYTNGFTILKISEIKDKTESKDNGGNSIQ